MQRLALMPCFAAIFITANTCFLRQLRILYLFASSPVFLASDRLERATILNPNRNIIVRLLHASNKISKDIGEFLKINGKNPMRLVSLSRAIYLSRSIHTHRYFRSHRFTNDKRVRLTCRTRAIQP